MVTIDKRRSLGFNALPERSGQLNIKSKFDPKFFGISENEANLMDSQLRLMIEVTYEAIYDAGIDPSSLSGTCTGTFAGAEYNDVPFAQGEDFPNVIGYQQNFASRIAEIFNFKGPSIATCSACSSSLIAMNEAVFSMRKGLCQSAVVIGVNISLKPIHNYIYSRLNMLSLDGKCKCLDSGANGYAKSESCVVVFLQQRRITKRIYATVVHIETNNDGFKPRSSLFPSAKAQSALMKKVCRGSGIDPLSINYLEAHCTGTAAGDVVEMSAILDAYCKDRQQPLLIGAVKSNIGHSEAGSGLCSLIKVLLSFEKQCIPPNLHMNIPNPKIPGLISGILKPVITNTPFFGTLAAINNFGYGGSNVHMILRADSEKSFSNEEDIFEYLPRLILMCGLNRELLEHNFNTILNNPRMLSNDYLGLLNGMSKISPWETNENCIKGMKYRGFAILDNINYNKMKTNTVQINKSFKTKPQIWYVLSIIENKWREIAKSLMKMKLFAQSVKKSAEVLNEYAIDLISLLSDNNENTTNCSMKSFVCMTAIQIALVDVLKALDITADGMIGESISEIVCAYIDEIISRGEALQISYWMGKYISDALQTDSKLTKWNDKIESVSQMSSTMKESLISRLEKIIPVNRLRSPKWISSTYEESDPKYKYISAEYFLQSITNSGISIKAISKIPNDVVVIGMSFQHHFELNIEERLCDAIKYVPLLNTNDDYIKYFMESIGKLYNFGANPSIEKLYTNVGYPVSRGTPLLSPLVKWKHRKSYKSYEYPEYFKPIDSTEFEVEFDLNGKDSYLLDHCIDGNVLFPLTGYLLSVWKIFARRVKIKYEDLSVEFNNVCLLHETILQNVGIIKFLVNILETNGNFVVKNCGRVVVTGSIIAIQKPLDQFDNLFDREMMSKSVFFDEKNESILKNNDIYKDLRNRGYEYKKEFQNLSKLSIDFDKIKASIKWCDNWITFVDSLMQMSIFNNKSAGLYLPQRIDCIRYDPKTFLANINQMNCEDPEILAYYDCYSGFGSTEGLEFIGLKFVLIKKSISQIPIIDDKCYLSNNMSELHSLESTSNIQNTICYSTKYRYYQHSYLNNITAGDISSFRWFDCSHKYWPLGRKPNEKLYYIYYASLNENDKFIALGKTFQNAIPEEISYQDSILGLEFSGRDENNIRVMGMTSSKCLATSVVLTESDFVWHIPDKWTMLMASTVPVFYCTAYYALIVRGKLSSNETVLINIASDGLRQAIISICHSYNCQLFITCNSETERQFLSTEYSLSYDKNFCNTNNFISHIMNETNGQGVDVVINSQSGVIIQSGSQCLTKIGRFLHIGKYDLLKNRNLDLSGINENKIFHGIVMETLFDSKCKTIPIVKRHKAELQKLMEYGIKNETVRPLMTNVFDSTQVEEAFRYMLSNNNVGKVVLKIRDEETD